MRRIFWLVWAVAMCPLIAWALISKKTDLILPLVLCGGLFMGLASLKREDVNGDPTFLHPPWVWGSEFLQEIKVAVGVIVVIAWICWSSFINWNKWGPAVAQVAIVGIVAALLTWVGLSQRIKASKYKDILFWAAWIAASLVLSLLINRWLILILSIPFFFGNWAKENEKLNSSYRTPSH